MSCVCKRLGRVVDSFSLEKVGWRCAAHVYSSCASCGFLHYIHQFFFPHSWGAFCENVDARLWTLGTAALACYIPLRTRAHSSFPFFPAFVPLTSPPHPYLTNTVSFISSQTKFHDQSNHSPIPHSIPYSLLYFYPHPRPESPLVLPSQLFFCLYCWVVRPAPLLSSWGQPFSTLLHDFAPPPSRFSGNFSHKISPHFFITSHFPGFTHQQTSNEKKPALAPPRLGLAVVRWTRIMYNNLRASCHPWRRGCTFILYSALSISFFVFFLHPCRPS